MNITLSPRQSAFADLVSQPEKLNTALKAARSENDVFAATRRFGLPATGSATANTSQRGNGALTFSNRTWSELRETEFRLLAPSAALVLLAADFTTWEKFPLDMVKDRDGVWSIVVLLPSGIYTYRFIVDGKWCDDPRAEFYARNPFGTVDAVIEVT